MDSGTVPRTGRPKFALPVLRYSGAASKGASSQAAGRPRSSIFLNCQTELWYPYSSVFETARLDPEEYYPYLLLPLQLLNLNDPIRVAQLTLPVVA